MPVFLEVNNLKCGYPDNFMLNDICFSIKKGSFTGIIGPNGSGKTTLLKGIIGEIPLKNGNISLNNIDISTLSNKHKAQKIAIVTQNTEISDICVEDYVLMGRFPYKKRFHFFENENDYQLAHKYLKLTNSFHYKDKMMSELSGGEQQLVAIAKALTQEPELLLLDEPTSHLDISHQMQILDLIQELNESLNLTVIMTIHDLNLAAEYCNYLIMMNNGSIHEKNTPEDVLTYKNIEEVYDTIVITQTNPLSKKPAIFLISKKVLSRQKQ